VSWGSERPAKKAAPDGGGAFRDRLLPVWAKGATGRHGAALAWLERLGRNLDRLARKD